ncbi:MAG: diaminopimelate epimerase [Saprospiraceae bacterium]
MKLNFVKMHGLGNDFIIPEGQLPEGVDISYIARVLCDRHTGVGADGILLVLPSEIAEFKMRIINADGSEAEMCGNGIRCFAKYVYEEGKTKNTIFDIETLAGNIKPELILENGKVFKVKVNMDLPKYLNNENEIIQNIESLEKDKIHKELTLKSNDLEVTSFIMGVPHTMVFVDEIDFQQVVNTGSEIEKNPEFINGTNVNFVEVINENEISLSTWERGAGRTLACGTGSCASALASFYNGMTNNNVTVHLELGDLFIEIEENAVYMTGPAEYVFRGSIEIIS